MEWIALPVIDPRLNTRSKVSVHCFLNMSPFTFDRKPVSKVAFPSAVLAVLFVTVTCFCIRYLNYPDAGIIGLVE